MTPIQEVKLAVKANELVNAVGRIKFPQGQYATYIGAVVLLVSQWLASNSNLVPAEWHAYLPPVLAALTGIHTLSALAWPPRGSAWSVSAVWVVFTQSLGVVLQTCNSLLQVSPPEWRDNISNGIQVLMAMQTMTSLHKESQ